MRQVGVNSPVFSGVLVYLGGQPLTISHDSTHSLNSAAVTRSQ